MSEMVDRVARVIGDTISPNLRYDGSSLATRKACERAARAAVEAMREPTEGMIDEVTSDEPTVRQLEGDHAERYRAMIDAALR